MVVQMLQLLQLEYHVTDTTAPIITVTPLVITLKLNSDLQLTGVSTQLTGTVVVSTVGDYTIRYDSTDDATTATSINRYNSSNYHSYMKLH